MKERSDYFLGAEVFALCKDRSCSIEELTEKVYGNCYAKNLVRVYQVIQVFMKRGLLVPQFKHRVLSFTVNGSNEEIKK